jgi:hypothetical protein
MFNPNKAERSTDSARIRLLQHQSPDKQREAIKTYIKVKLDRLENYDNYDINDGLHDMADIFDNIKDQTLKGMFEGSGIPYTNENIAERLDAANLSRVTDIEKSSPRVLSLSLAGKALNFVTEDVVDEQSRIGKEEIQQQRIDKYKRYRASIQGGNTFASKLHTLPPHSSGCCILQGGGFGRIKKTKNIRCKNKSHRIQLGGCTDRQKGIAAQIRTFTHGDLREELNNIVHSGDSVSAKSHYPSNPYIDLSNSFDTKAEDVINRAIKFIKENEHINYKNKKKILNGISQFNTMTNANATTFNNKSTTSLSSQVTPKKTFKDAMTANRMTTNAPISRSRTSRRGRSRRSRRGRSRRSRRSRS